MLCLPKTLFYYSTHKVLPEDSARHAGVAGVRAKCRKGQKVVSRSQGQKVVDVSGNERSTVLSGSELVGIEGVKSQLSVEGRVAELSGSGCLAGVNGEESAITGASGAVGLSVVESGAV